MKIVTWNVNGLRACLNKGFMDFFAQVGADIFCVQETKMQPDQAQIETPGYHQYWHSAEKKGYSGTAVFSKQQPLSVRRDFGVEQHSHEGRVLTLEYPDFYLVNVYSPNSQDKLARLDYRLEWEDAFRAYLLELDAQKPVVVCGDMNVAHCEIDLKNPKTNRKNAGFSDEERQSFGKTLASGFTDVFRALNPDLTGAYTWWSYRFNARKNNAGWRIDYFLVSQRLFEQVQGCTIFSDVLGSDHCPVLLEL
ncbi:exodeoxyribonuclease III [Neobittarella massiliensis]|uniref:exodeoxyribonuclease III n=1 Tax=Neobittarella massiliensis (ex Bilen et al. 2018) TaxID=2041842 RepID=UPI000CF62097|nr:exodeoxyribonuclease III [Neobittarella massiliensis]